MKKQILILTTIIILALIAAGCNIPLQGYSPEEPWVEGPPPEEYPEEEFRPEEHPEDEFPPEEHPEEPLPEEMGEAHIVHFEAHRTRLGPGECTGLEWHVEGAHEVFLNGEPTEPSGGREICPSETTGYHLFVESGGRSDEREIVVEVEGAGPAQPAPQGNQPQQPQQPQQQPKPTPTLAMVTLPGADLALTDLYPDKLKNGKVYARITNHGPDKVTNLTISFSCNWAKTGYGAAFGVNESVGPKNITIKSLNPGQTTPFNTSVTVDLTQYWYNMTCKIQVPFANLNTNSGNDSYTEKLAK
jgi:hypothetical protein